MIRGMTIVLYEKTPAGVNSFGEQIFEEETVEVEDCLVSPVSAEDVVSDLRLYGKKAVYQIAIPKGDTHIWEDRTVEFFGEKWRTFGFVEQGIEENVPLRWHKKVKVERFG